MIHIDATIAGDTSRTLPFSLGRTAGARTVVDALNAASDPGIVGVVLRVDSLGAKSCVGSDRARGREAQRSEAGRGELRRCCGEWRLLCGVGLARDLRRTDDSPARSVCFRYASAEALLGRLGISVGTLLRGERANSATWLRDPSAGDQTVLKRQVDVAYERFLGWVVRGAGWPRRPRRAPLLEGADVWSGADARTHQLVDTLGGSSTPFAR